MDNKVNFLRGTATEYEAATKDNDTFYYTTDTEKLYLGNKEITGGGVTIDDTLSDTSKNPVQNKVINAALNNKADLTDIPTALPANGGNADTVDGKHASDVMVMGLSYSNRTKVTSSDNLDNYRTVGKFVVPDIATASSLGNSAFTDTGYFLDVWFRTTTLTVQIAMSWAGVIKIRNSTSATNWTAWRKINDGGDANTANTSNTADTANTAGTLATTPTNVCLRNISAGTADLSAGVSELATGAIYLVYE